MNYIFEVRFPKCGNVEDSIEDEIISTIDVVTREISENEIQSDEIEGIFLRLDVTVTWANFPNLSSYLNRAYPQIKRRFTNVKVIIIYFDGRKIQAFPENTPDIMLHIDKVKNDEMESFLETSHSIIDGNGTRYFQHPSGKICDYFVRVGNLISRFDFLEKCSFWCLPRLNDVSRIVCDTWTISTFGMYLSFLAGKIMGREVDCIYLSNYLSDGASSISQLGEIFENSDIVSDEILFLISASQSGKIASRYQKIHESLTGKEFARILVLFNLSDQISVPNYQILCDAKDVLKRRSLVGEIDEDSIDSTVPIYSIDRSTYFPSYQQVREQDFRIRNHTRKSKIFFEKYAGKSAFSVCKNGKTRKKMALVSHHTFHIDSEKIFETDEFKEELRAKLSILPAPSIVVHLTKDADVKLASLVEDFYKNNTRYSRPDLIEVSSFGEIGKNQQILGLVDAVDENILFINSMQITGGSSVEALQKGLRRVSDAKDKNGSENGREIRCSLTYLVGISRPPSESQAKSDFNFMLKNATDIYKSRFIVDHVEKILLPDWREDSCPWCNEQKKLSEVLLLGSSALPDSSVRGRVAKRMSSLKQQQGRGIIHDLLFPNRENVRFEFTGGSLWVDVNKIPDYSEADIILAVASTIQYWRDAQPRTHSVQYVFPSADFWSKNRYNDALLRGAIWRSLLSNEVPLVFDEYFKDQLVDAILNQDTSSSEGASDLSVELALIMGRRLRRLIGRKDNCCEYAAALSKLEY